MALTGSYFSHAHVIDMQRRINTTIEVRFMDKRGKHVGIPRNYKNKRLPLTMVQAITAMSQSEIERRDLVSYKNRLVEEYEAKI